MATLINRERVSDLLCGALEGGSNYWYYLPKLKKDLNSTEAMNDQPLVDRIITAVYDHNISVSVYDYENPSDKLGEFNLENIARGEKLMAENHKEHFANVIDEEDDAETADVWFQLVVMGELVFG